MKYLLYFDGASKGNPGPAGAGAHIIPETGKDLGLKSSLGKQTNNYAEYCGLILGLNYLLEEVKIVPELTIRGDSKLVIEQLSGNWKVKSSNLFHLYQDAKSKLHELRQRGCQVHLEYIPREKNAVADRLANEGI